MTIMVGMHAILWVEQFWNVHPQKLDCEIFEDGPSAKIGSLENFQLYGNNMYIHHQGQVMVKLTFEKKNLGLPFIITVEQFNHQHTNSPVALSD